MLGVHDAAQTLVDILHVNRSGKRRIGKYHVVFARNGVVLRDTVEVAHVRRVHPVEHQVHGRDTKHGLVDLEARELRGSAVLTGIGVPVVASHLAFMGVTNVLRGRDEEARGAARRVADKFAWLGVDHGHHHVADVLRRAELAVGARGRQLREHVLVEVAQIIHVVVKLGEETLHAIDRPLEQGGLARRKAERRAFHCLGEGRLVAELFDERERKLIHHAVHSLRGEVLETTPAQLVAGNLDAVGVAVRLGEDAVELGSEHLLHLLGLKLLLVERAHEHEVGELAYVLDGVGDAALPHLLPDCVHLTFGCSCNHGYRPFFESSSIMQVRTKALKLIPRRDASAFAASRSMSGILSVTETWFPSTR